MSLTIGIVLYPDVEELDAVGPWEVFTSAAEAKGDRVVTIAEESGTIRCAKGMRIVPDHGFADAPDLDVLVVPGGNGRRTEMNNPRMLDWLASASERATWVASVCTGAFLLHAAGPARGKTVTTYWHAIPELKDRGDVDVRDDVRYVRDGKLVTAAGVSAGIDMALWLVAQLYDEEYAREVQRDIEYYPEPPFDDKRGSKKTRNARQ